MSSYSVPIIQELGSSISVMDAVRACADLPRLLLLDSAAVRAERGRYSFLMADPLICFDVAIPEFGSDPFSELRKFSQRFHSATVPDLPPFQGGAAGLMGYELGRCWERIGSQQVNTAQIPAMSAGIYPWVIAWDHVQSRVWLIAQGWSQDSSESSLALAENRAVAVLDRLSQPVTDGTPTIMTTNPVPAWGKPVAEGLWSDLTRDEYLSALQRVIDYIYAGDIFQANLTQRLLCRAPESAISVYHRLRKVNPAPFAGLYLCDDWAILSASPERFLQVTGRTVSTRPIKGTRRRSSQAEADLFTRDSLRQSEKDQAENVMIVDLLRNDLSRVCLPESVHVPLLCEVETYATVQHLVSEICGELADGCSPWDLFAATFPGGSITGAPKVRAMEIIAELEPTVRGPYTGSLFYVGHDGTTDSNLLIRTFVMRHGWLECGVGGGIVAQSDPVSEYAETWHKAAGMLQAVGLKGVE